MDVSLIRPTGTCFDDALDFIAEVLRSFDGAAKVAFVDSLSLVHGICVAWNGTKYAHAWVEQHDQVWQGGMLNGQRVYYQLGSARFYELHRVLECTRYTVQEAIRLNEQHDNFGPWEERYRSLVLPRSDAQ